MPQCQHVAADISVRFGSAAFRVKRRLVRSGKTFFGFLQVHLKLFQIWQPTDP